MESLMEARVFDNDGLSSRLATTAFIHKLSDIKPDIVHLHNIHGYQINYPILFNYLKKNNIKVVWTIHDCWPLTGHCAHFAGCGCEKWKTLCYACPLKNNYPASWLFDGSRRNYEKKKRAFLSKQDIVLVPVSKWMGEMVGQSFLSEFPRVVIYNGVDTDKFKICQSDIKGTLNIKGKTMLLGVATAWTEGKGLYDYFELSNRLDPKRFQIVLVGLTAKQRQSLPSSIIGIEKISARELVAYYNAADIVLNLSYAESFGLSTIEGMSCGTPGIVYDQTASPELVTSDTGIVVKAGDISALVDAIDEICRRGKQGYAESCRKRAEECFNAEIQYEKYLDLYKSILAKS